MVPGPAVSAGSGDSTAVSVTPDIPAGGVRGHDLASTRDGPASCCGNSREAQEACRRERARLEANKIAAARLLQMFDNPVLARREYNRYVRNLNASIRAHNAVCKPHPISPLPT